MTTPAVVIMSRMFMKHAPSNQEAQGINVNDSGMLIIIQLKSLSVLPPFSP